MQNDRWYIWCDESVKKGKHYSNFYGGIIINSKDYFVVDEILRNNFEKYNINSEMKWEKINQHHLENYIEMVNLIFSLIKSGKVKIRIMFTKNDKTNTSLLNKYQKDHSYHLLYYQFIKRSFGLQYLKNNKFNYLEFFLDILPERKDKNDKFKQFILGIANLDEFKSANLIINKDAISEVDSKKHLPLQCLDIILGAIAFQLNKMNAIKSAETGKRGRRTIAKEKVYNIINKNIRDIYPNFNIGITTGKKENLENIWYHPYRHWLFMSDNE